PFVLHYYALYTYLPSFPTRRSSDLIQELSNIFLSAISFITGSVIEKGDINLNEFLLKLVNNRPFICIVASLVVTALDLCFNSSIDRKSTRLNSSHVSISYAVFCLKK